MCTLPCDLNVLISTVNSLVLKSVRYISQRLGKRYVWNRGRQHLIVRRLTQNGINYIIHAKNRGKSTRDISLEMKVCGRWVQKIYKRYRDTGEIPVLGTPGRPKREITDPMRQAVADCFGEYRLGAVGLEHIIDYMLGMHIPHNTVHLILKDCKMAEKQKKKSRKRKWVRYERTHSNSMWHTDYKLLKDGRWLICYTDDVSRFIARYGVFDEATSKNAILVLRKAVSEYGRPASMLTDRGSQFYASESECKRKGVSEFEQELVSLGIRHILARVCHPQTNGKLERFHGEINRKQKWFKDIDELIHWWNNTMPHMSLDWDTLETPARAFGRKMPPKGATVIDEQSGEVYDVR